MSLSVQRTVGFVLIALPDNAFLYISLAYSNSHLLHLSDVVRQLDSIFLRSTRESKELRRYFTASIIAAPLDVKP